MSGEILVGSRPDKLRIANRWMLSADEFPMRLLHIILIHHRILERGVDALMAEKLLHLLDGHPLVDSHRC